MIELIIAVITVVGVTVGITFEVWKMVKNGPTSTRRWNEKKRRY